MRPSSLLRTGVAAALVLAAAAVLPSARAEEPDRSQWLVGRDYKREAAFTAPGGGGIEAYVAAQEGPAGDSEDAWYRFLLLRKGEVVETYAVDVTRTEG